MTSIYDDLNDAYRKLCSYEIQYRWRAPAGLNLRNARRMLAEFTGIAACPIADSAKVIMLKNAETYNNALALYEIDYAWTREGVVMSEEVVKPEKPIWTTYDGKQLYDHFSKDVKGTLLDIISKRTPGLVRDLPEEIQLGISKHLGINRTARNKKKTRRKTNKRRTKKRKRKSHHRKKK